MGPDQHRRPPRPGRRRCGAGPRARRNIQSLARRSSRPAPRAAAGVDPAQAQGRPLESSTTTLISGPLAGTRRSSTRERARAIVAGSSPPPPRPAARRDGRRHGDRPRAARDAAVTRSLALLGPPRSMAVSCDCAITRAAPAREGGRQPTPPPAREAAQQRQQRRKRRYGPRPTQTQRRADATTPRPTPRPPAPPPPTTRRDDSIRTPLAHKRDDPRRGARTAAGAARPGRARRHDRAARPPSAAGLRYHHRGAPRRRSVGASSGSCARPTVEYGVHAPTHAFPGGAALRRRTLHRVMNELIESWEEGAGVREFVILTAQASEATWRRSARFAPTRPRSRSSMSSASISAPLLERPGAPIQGGELDTSLLLYLAPETGPDGAGAGLRGHPEHARTATGRGTAAGCHRARPARSDFPALPPPKKGSCCIDSSSIGSGRCLTGPR